VIVVATAGRSRFEPDATQSGLMSVRSIFRTSPLVVCAVLLTGGFFFRSGSPFEQHPLAFGGVREAVLGLCVVAAAAYATDQLRRGTLSPGDGVVLAFVPAAIFTSALLANFRFGQPLLYGLLEERRIFSFYGVFLMALALRGTARPGEVLLGALFWCAAIQLALGMMLQTGVLGDLAHREIGDLDPRKWRILTGNNLYAATVAIAVVLLVRYWHLPFGVPLVIGLVGLMVISQTRSTTVQLALTVGIVLFAVSRARLALLLIGGAAGIATVILALSILLEEGGRTGIGEVDVRLETVRKILHDLAVNDWIGMGALSLQWNGGFHRIYDRFFYLTDVGMFGEFYRYGVLLPLFYAALGLALAAYAARLVPSMGRLIVAVLSVLVVMGIFGQGLISQTGGDWALVFAFAKAWAGPVDGGRLQGTTHQFRTFGPRIRFTRE
jgi:hypothetical protein